MQLHEDVMRKALRLCAPGTVLRFGTTSRDNRALAREEALWEALFVRAGARFRPSGVWAAAAAAATDDELAPGSWWEAFRDYVRHPSVGSLVLNPGPSKRRLRVASGALALHQALERAESGDVIELAPGVYPQCITLSRAITLVGDCRDCVQVGSVLTEVDGVTLARLTILGTVQTSTEAEAAGGMPVMQPAVCVSAGSARVYDCNLRGAWGIEVEAGACHVFCCDIEAQHACFRGAGEIDACRLEICAPASAVALPGTEVQAALVFRTGKSRLANCLVEGGSDGVHVQSGASCQIRDCDIQAKNCGVSVQGSRNAQDCAHLLLQNSRVHSCLAAGVRMEAAGACLQLVETEFSHNAVGVLAEGWRHPELCACHLTDRGIRRTQHLIASGNCRGTGTAKPGAARCRAGKGEGAAGGEKRKTMKRTAAAIKKKPDRRDMLGRRVGAPACTWLGIEACDFRSNVRNVEVVTLDLISSTWTVPLGNQ